MNSDKKCSKILKKKPTTINKSPVNWNQRMRKNYKLRKRTKIKRKWGISLPRLYKNTSILLLFSLKIRKTMKIYRNKTIIIHNQMEVFITLEVLIIDMNETVLNKAQLQEVTEMIKSKVEDTIARIIQKSQFFVVITMDPDRI